MSIKVLIMLRPPNGESDEHTPIVDDTPEARTAAQAHLDAGHIVCIIGRYGTTEDDQIWGDMSALAEEWRGCKYSIWCGGGYDHPLNDLAEAVEYVTGIAQGIAEPKDPPTDW